MKKLVTILIISFSFQLLPVKADEGMWLAQMIGDKTYADMVKRGLKLSKEQLYSINKNTIKDAIVIFGNGCTAEIVSKEGLLFTNHHCGYDAITSSSSVQHNYLAEGFWAKTKKEEISCPGLSVQFLVKIEDVTETVAAKLKDLKPGEIVSKLTAIITEMSTKATDGSGNEVRVSSFFKGNQFLQFTYQRFKDIRLVGAPPENIGKFGGDTDNWEWPRHTCDFSIFRVYMAPDGKPAEYKTENVPYVPKHSLPVSIKGINDGDYAMIYGYPGTTTRYETSYGVRLKIDIENPNTVSLRDARLKSMKAEMVKDPATKIQLASSYAGIANYWKFFDGESKQLVKHNVIAQKEKDEAAFVAWAKGKSEYDNIFSDIKTVYDNWRPYAKQRVYIFEGILGSPLLSFAASLKALDAAITSTNSADLPKVVIAEKASYAKFIKGENVASDRNIVAQMIQLFHKDISESQQPTAFYATLKTAYGDLDADDTYRKFSKDVFENTFLLNEARFEAFISKPDTAMLHKDPAYKVAMSFVNNYNNNYAKYATDFIANNYALNRKYQKGILEMKKGQALYPDANQTMRISFGNVKSYVPRDAVKYSEVCTLKGVMEKYLPGDLEFDVPSKLVSLIADKDYGQYIDKKANDIVVSFITTNDITGGNSGSPVLNGKGELIGLAFDGNYEALSHKIVFDSALNRTICVDIRYVLFIIDKLGGAKNLIDELTITKI